MAHLLTPTLEVRASRKFLENQPTSTYCYIWLQMCPNIGYNGLWTGYDTNYIENTIGAGISFSYGTGSGASSSFTIPSGRYSIHYHVEIKCDSSNSGAPLYLTNDIDVNTTSSDRKYFTVTDHGYATQGLTLYKNVKQKNVQFCSSRSNTSAIETNRSYMTWDHWMEWEHTTGYGGGTPSFPTYPWIPAQSGFVSVEDFWFILRRVR